MSDSKQLTCQCYYDWTDGTGICQECGLPRPVDSPAPMQHDYDDCGTIDCAACRLAGVVDSPAPQAVPDEDCGDPDCAWRRNGFGPENDAEMIAEDAAESATPLPEATERERFEKWAIEEADLPTSSCDCLDCRQLPPAEKEFRYNTTQVAWEAWQASRKAEGR